MGLCGLPAPDADSSAVVDEISSRLNVPLTPAEKTECMEYLDSERDNNGNVTQDPFDPQGDPTEAEDRVRGVLWILGQHPDYMIR